MIIEEFLKLPPWITHEGITFQLQLINDGGTEAKLCYGIESVDESSPHRSEIKASGSWYNNLHMPGHLPQQGFLKLYEGIYNDSDLAEAIIFFREWLEEKELI